MTAAITSTCGLFCTSLAALLCFPTASAQTVYRCGPLGNQYSQQPCEHGKVVDVADPRSAAQVDAALKAIAEQRRRGLELASQRRSDERAMRPAVAAGIGPAPANVDRSSAKTKSATTPRPTGRKSSTKQNETGNFAAIEPGSGKPKKKKKA